MNNSGNTLNLYHRVLEDCKAIFKDKNKDYGLSWKILRTSSLTDQIYIKAKRIKFIEQSSIQKIKENVTDEFIGIINYCIMTLILIENQREEISESNIFQLYDKSSAETKNLFKNKNHDYDEAWRDMRVSSMTDIILVKLLRIKQIEENQEKLITSEGIKSNYQDIMNYAVFCLIKMKKL